MWLATYKPFGLEVIERRYGGLIARLQSLFDRLKDYLEGDVQSIPELEIEPQKIWDGSPDYLPTLNYSRARAAEDLGRQPRLPAHAQLQPRCHTKLHQVSARPPGRSGGRQEQCAASLSRILSPCDTARANTHADSLSSLTRPADPENGMVLAPLVACAGCRKEYAVGRPLRQGVVRRQVGFCSGEADEGSDSQGSDCRGEACGRRA